MSELRPADVCRQLLAALDASDGRRRRRRRDTTPDRIGMGIKRALLERAAVEDPDPDAFDAWLASRCMELGEPDGAARAMAREIIEEWRLARSLPSFRAWLARGAPSDDSAT